ncbi:DUF998 domain-containing protein [Lysobacter arvi]|uniref:DUF998 domain-containing protein n=1 Tax=Lysobacter arvi TaxID=3038776 RepID=A0ABU1CC43_9GAMM|nr:DUF998 domain-containing protein [Lysobacter arvi]MDR0182695.1 DUF998 domain-containing protein [Lysobacter arvi]
MNRPFPSSLIAFERHAGWIALACCAIATLGLAAALPAFSHAQHPLGLLGAAGVPGAMLFNVLGFLVPGLLAAWVFVRLRDRLPVGAARWAGIGCWMLALSALAFAAQGAWRLDPADLDGPSSQRHATAWLLWWLAFAVGALVTGLGLIRDRVWRGVSVAFVAAGAIGVLLNVYPVLAGPIAQRVVLLAWLVCVVVASRTGGMIRIA